MLSCEVYGLFEAYIMITNSLGILGARANAECLEDMLGIMVGSVR